jgi:flagellar basal body-associated protein FliL
VEEEETIIMIMIMIMIVVVVVVVVLLLLMMLPNRYIANIGLHLKQSLRTTNMTHNQTLPLLLVKIQLVTGQNIRARDTRRRLLT